MTPRRLTSRIVPPYPQSPKFHSNNLNPHVNSQLSASSQLSQATNYEQSPYSSSLGVGESSEVDVCIDEEQLRQSVYEELLKFPTLHETLANKINQKIVHKVSDPATSVPDRDPMLSAQPTTSNVQSNQLPFTSNHNQELQQNTGFQTVQSQADQQTVFDTNVGDFPQEIFNSIQFEPEFNDFISKIVDKEIKSTPFKLFSPPSQQSDSTTGSTCDSLNTPNVPHKTPDYFKQHFADSYGMLNSLDEAPASVIPVVKNLYKDLATPEKVASCSVTSEIVSQPQFNATSLNKAVSTSSFTSINQKRHNPNILSKSISKPVFEDQHLLERSGRTSSNVSRMVAAQSDLREALGYKEDRPVNRFVKPNLTTTIEAVPVQIQAQQPVFQTLDVNLLASLGDVSSQPLYITQGADGKFTICPVITYSTDPLVQSTTDQGTGGSVGSSSLSMPVLTPTTLVATGQIQHSSTVVTSAASTGQLPTSNSMPKISQSSSSYNTNAQDSSALNNSKRLTPPNNQAHSSNLNEESSKKQAKSSIKPVNEVKDKKRDKSKDGKTKEKKRQSSGGSDSVANPKKTFKRSLEADAAKAEPIIDLKVNVSFSRI